MASPACTELEVVMLDWLGKMLDLPNEFLACSGGKGGGVIQVSKKKRSKNHIFQSSFAMKKLSHMGDNIVKIEMISLWKFDFISPGHG